MVNFKDHIRNEKFLPFSDRYFTDKPYAYGVLINPIHSNILALDFDTTELSVIENVIDQIADTGIAKHFDIASTTRRKKDTINRHLYVGLDRCYNTYPFYGANITGVCNGYLSCIRQKGEVVVRLSQKFNKGMLYGPNGIDLDTDIKWEKGYSREGKVWLTYSSEQLIAPLTTADGASSEGTHVPIRQSLRLRG